MDSPFKSQLVKYPYLGIETRGSYNGLILLSILKDMHASVADLEESLCLCNPSTKEFKEISILNVKHGPAYNMKLIRKKAAVIYGLGHNCNTDNYKIVKVVPVSAMTPLPVCYGSEVQVYTLGLDSWKTLPDIIPYKLDAGYHKAATVINGAPQWIACRDPVNSDFSGNSKCIVSFDSGGDNFREVPISTQIVEEFNHHESHNRVKTLGVLGGCLCLIVYDHYHTYEVWVMNDCKTRESWNKLYVGQIPVKDLMDAHGHVDYYNSKFVWEFKNDEVLFAVKRKYLYYTNLVTYDLVPVPEKSKVSKIRDFLGQNCSVETYLVSLVSLNPRIYEREQEHPNTQAQALSKISLKGREESIC
ncbi:F-box protein At4g22390-like [Papaver somniferum]|nr:F-box protein At4g22390-like [Papaver somniferum]